MSVSIVIKPEGVEALIELLNKIASFRLDSAASLVAPILENQTRRRIESEKTSPEGRSWLPNRAGTSTLLKTGRNLRDSIAHRTNGNEAIVEAHWRHAHVHQTGKTITPKSAKRLVFKIGGQTVFARKVVIPARPFIGLSRDNETEIVEELNAMLADKFGGVLQ